MSCLHVSLSLIYPLFAFVCRTPTSKVNFDVGGRERETNKTQTDERGRQTDRETEVRQKGGGGGEEGETGARRRRRERE